MSNKGELIGLIVFLLGCFCVAGLGSLATRPEIPTWYQAIRKPAWTPPNWLFGPVWAALYAAQAVAAWMVWKRAGWAGSEGALWLFVSQLALNLTWSFIFFKFHSPQWAFVEIVALWAAIAATLIKFAGVSQVSAMLLVPYLVWVTYAAALNFAIWTMNE
jgi:benzodiazapine receptor